MKQFEYDIKTGNLSENLVDLFVEIDRIYCNVTDNDQLVFLYLLERCIFDFYHGTYDDSYKLPWTDLRG